MDVYLRHDIGGDDRMYRRHRQSCESRACKSGDPRIEYMKERDVHSQARERTNGIVRNVDEWYDSYDIKSGALYLKPSERVQIW